MYNFNYIMKNKKYIQSTTKMWIDLEYKIYCDIRFYQYKIRIYFMYNFKFSLKNI